MYDMEVVTSSEYSGAEEKAIGELSQDPVLRRTLQKLCNEIIRPAKSTLETSDEMKEIWKARGKLEALQGLVANIDLHVEVEKNG